MRWQLALLSKGALWENGAKRAGAFTASSFTWTNNLAAHGEYRIWGDGVGAALGR